MIRWSDGLENGPDGACRQLPQRHVWSSTVWVNPDGVTRRRFYNPLSGVWTWAREPVPLTINDDGRAGYMLEWWLSVDRCVALAWLHRAPDGSDRVQEKVTVRLMRDDDSSVSEGEAPRVETIEWVDGDAPDDGARIVGERWKPLRWSCGLAPCDQRYKISDRGRLKSPHTGEVTEGFWFGDDRWAAVKGSGLVPLLTAAKLRPAHDLQPRVRLARDALMHDGQTGRKRW